ncbi:hypothetical protein HUK80_17420 [Flavobacterium sp. MAH-1]|uniref:YD repeat-containing protein n=1 Tax=Flavobacterium agri TaxID=2743471 RepID=A0A7Y9C7T3_9FLAO|nr:hypothetical protein [Flavobacterium agri]NUY82686.1 hypothetical protein [Flavobacterium agri]NYA72709.1 hypothetical protein [Flavobacterium agri]
MKVILLILSIIFFNSSFAQEERYQPDSIYANRKVKIIKIFINSPQDLSQIVHLNKSGQPTKVENYDASYDKKSRETKRLHSVSFYYYNDKQKLVKVVDSAMYSSGSRSTGKTFFEYDNDGFLKCEKYFRNDDLESYRQINYSYSPYRTNLITRNDTIVTLNETMEYDKDFYTSRQHGFYFQPKVEYKTVTENGIEFHIQHDYLERRETDLHFNNKFDSQGKRISSNLINKGHKVHKLEYRYFANGLLKSESGYVPIYFEYDYFK